ncbi:MAG: hypothetical protein JWP92_2396 [Caulobacter sp.]|nr:hypothetical protein [Caulobacter sp.]
MAAAFFCGEAVAGAWPMAPGETQTILKYERQTADQAFDPSRRRVALGARRDESLSLFVEHGLTGRLTVQGKLGVTRGHDPAIGYDGRGPTELGLRYAVLRTDRSAVSLYAGAIEGGVGRNAGYAAPGVGGADLELRLLAGRSGAWRARPVFAELQLARLDRRGLPDEDRLDATLGLEPRRDWLLLVQAYAGRARTTPIQPRWLKLEASAVRRFGPWRLQAGWRAAVAGQESPIERGPVLGIWRSL